MHRTFQNYREYSAAWANYSRPRCLARDAPVPVLVTPAAVDAMYKADRQNRILSIHRSKRGCTFIDVRGNTWRLGAARAALKIYRDLCGFSGPRLVRRSLPQHRCKERNKGEEEEFLVAGRIAPVD